MSKFGSERLALLPIHELQRKLHCRTNLFLPTLLRLPLRATGTVIDLSPSILKTS